ncbi:hypothetical protein ACQI4F_01155 [Mycolicibacterium vaccae]|uniref:hypothetical protein n=1 Tax=Mycolicibacterium vaccae TaxID=1810 RepID=UPI003CF0DBE2
MTAVLAAADFVRAPVLAAANPHEYKEWHHFVIHGRNRRILVNFSLTSESRGGRPPELVPRVIVIVHAHRWTGAVERFDPSATAISPDLGELSVGACRMTVLRDGYRITLALRDISGEIELTSVSRPFVVNNQPLGAGRMNWLFVPRLRAHGHLRIGGDEHRIHDELAYHDHNWGRFRWGDDFGWTWATILPSDTADPWSMVFLQMTDRRRLRFYSQAVYLWHHDDPAGIFRHAAVTAQSRGTLARPADCTLPPPMGLVLDGGVSGVPESVEISASRAGDTVQATFHAQSHARLAYPSETRLDGSVVLYETGGRARVTGTVAGKHLDISGSAVFEFLHG